MYRRNRRSRKWHRAPRFMNRGIPKGWLPPSISRRYNLHEKIINELNKILPITNVIFELGNFDIQKMENINIEGIEYQQGNLYQYNNVKEYLLYREKGKCQLCGKNKNEKFEIHHIEKRSKGGSNRLDNLALLHKSCHEKIHKNYIKLECKKTKSYKESTFMNIIRNKILNETDYQITYGYITKTKRLELNIEKSHINDAFVIAGGTNQERSNSYNISQKHRNNRCLQLNRKGYGISIRKKRYDIQPNDIVKVGNKKYCVSGIHNCGKSVVCKENGKKLDFGIKKIDSCFHFGTLVYFGRSAGNSFHD